MPLPDDPLTGILELILDQWLNQMRRLIALEGKLGTYAGELERSIKLLIEDSTDDTLRLRDEIEQASTRLRTAAARQREVAERFMMPDALLKTIDFFYPQLGVPDMKRRMRERLREQRNEEEALTDWLKSESERSRETSMNAPMETFEVSGGDGNT